MNEEKKQVVSWANPSLNVIGCSPALRIPKITVLANLVNQALLSGSSVTCASGVNHVWDLSQEIVRQRMGIPHQENYTSQVFSGIDPYTVDNHSTIYEYALEGKRFFDELDVLMNEDVFFSPSRSLLDLVDFCLSKNENGAKSKRVLITGALQYAFNEPYDQSLESINNTLSLLRQVADSGVCVVALSTMPQAAHTRFCNGKQPSINDLTMFDVPVIAREGGKLIDSIALLHQKSEESSTEWIAVQKSWR